MNQLTKKIIYLILVLFLLADFTWSFVQYLNQRLDGDMAWNLVPDELVKPVFQNPLGIATILENKVYANPNRFYCHWSYRKYLIAAPLYLQKFVDPISSVYLACAIAKIFIQLVLIFMLAVMISNTTNVLRLDFMLAAALIAPLFQANGYRVHMGIIDPATTYAFFYALPCALLMLYLMPFIRPLYYRKEPHVSFFFGFIWIPISLACSLSGPLNTGIALTASMLLFGNRFFTGIKNQDEGSAFAKMLHALKTIPASYWFYLLPLCLLSLYSLFLGRYNALTIATMIPLGEMYSRLPLGIFYQVSQDLSFPVLFGILGINIFLILKKYSTVAGSQIVAALKWIGLFSLVYILLLPLGGYREYRHYILRYDTILPVTLCLLFIFGASSLHLIKTISKKDMRWYLPVLLVVLFIYTNADRIKTAEADCEKMALKEIAASPEHIVPLDHDCSVLNWDKSGNPEFSEQNGKLLEIWGITKEAKLFYNR